jgi:hypothetical protein
VVSLSASPLSSFILSFPVLLFLSIYFLSFPSFLLATDMTWCTVPLVRLLLVEGEFSWASAWPLAPPEIFTTLSSATGHRINMKLITCALSMFWDASRRAQNSPANIGN